MNLAVIYNVFSGIELLQYAIAPIRHLVTYIAVQYQETDYYKKYTLTDEEYKLLKQLPIDELIKFTPSTPATNAIEAKKLEKEKRNQALNHCKNKGFKYYLNPDADEFYNPKQFGKAMEVIQKQNLEYTYCYYNNYYKTNIREKKISKAVVPFICSTKNSITSNTLPIIIDPTRGFEIMPSDRYKIFQPEELLMLHATGIRNDVALKYNSSSLANIDRMQIDDLSKQIQNLDENNLAINYKAKNNTIRIECETCDLLF